jgi:hypothetical protein
MQYAAAGHIFVDGIHGLRCACGRQWVHIQGTQESDIGKPDIAHYGNLTRSEYDSIVTLKKVFDRRFQSATYAGSGGGSLSEAEETPIAAMQDKYLATEELNFGE